MARTRSPDFEKRQQQILKSAAALFASRGYSETLLEDIAEHCGIKRSSIYHYHSSKHALLHHLIAWKIEDLTHKVEQAIATAASPRDKLHALVQALVEDYVRSPHEVILLNTQTRHLEEAALASTAALQNRLIGHVRQLIQALRPGLQIPKQHHTAITMLLFGMVNWVHVWYKPKGSLTPAQLVDVIVSLFLDGLLHQTASSRGSPSL
jgi:AcrR family transcriptional regulator